MLHPMPAGFCSHYTCFLLGSYCSLFCFMHSQKSKDTGDYGTCCKPIKSRKVPAEDFAFRDGEIGAGSNSESKVPS